MTGIDIDSLNVLSVLLKWSLEDQPFQMVWRQELDRIDTSWRQGTIGQIEHHRLVVDLWIKSNRESVR